MQRNSGEGGIVANGAIGELTQEQKDKAGKLILRFLDPEDLGFAVSGEVRDLVRVIIGREPVETKRGK